MTEIKTSDIATSAGHWYDRTGQMVETVPGAKGQPVKPDIRHARKLGLLPGVTSVIKVQSAPGLVNWMVDQALMAALTLPRVEGETLDAFKERARRDSQQQAEKARDKGSECHTALEMAVQRRPVAVEWLPHVDAVDKALRAVGVDFLAGDAERSFAHPLGFGGKNDWHSVKQGVLLDYKSKPKIDGRKMAYDEHVQQLSACAEGLLIPGCRLLSVFVGIEDVQAHVHEWQADEASRGWQMFWHCMYLWQLKNRYNSAFVPAQDKAA